MISFIYFPPKIKSEHLYLCHDVDWKLSSLLKIRKKSTLLIIFQTINFPQIIIIFFFDSSEAESQQKKLNMFLSYFLYIGKWRKKFRAQTCYHFSKKRQTTSIFIANTEFGSFDIKLNIIVLKCEAYSNFHFDFSLLSSLSRLIY